MITAIELANFKALREVTIKLSRFSLIVGPNASGKTSILEGLYYLTQLGETPPEALFTGERDPSILRTSGAPGPMALALTGSWNGARGSMGISQEAGSKFEMAARLQGRAENCERQVTGDPPAHKYMYASALRQEIVSAAFLRLDPALLAKPSYSEEIKPRFAPSGSNLAAVLVDLAITEPEEFQQLQARVRAVVPSLRSFRLQPIPMETSAWQPMPSYGDSVYRLDRTKVRGHQIRIDFEGSDALPPYLVSEGTLLTLGLLTVVSCASRPRLVLVDEMERALHPKALEELVRQIRALLEIYPDMQVIATTHSPYLVDHFDASEVVLTALREDGSVATGTLDEHPEFERWKDEMKPGEFWSTVGEEWLRERKAPKNG